MQLTAVNNQQHISSVDIAGKLVSLIKSTNKNKTYADLLGPPQSQPLPPCNGVREGRDEETGGGIYRGIAK